MITIESNKKLVLAREDHSLLTEYLKKNQTTSNNSKKHSILNAVENTEPIEDNDFPREVVRLNSRVIIRDKVAG